MLFQVVRNRRPLESQDKLYGEQDWEGTNGRQSTSYHKNKKSPVASDQHDYEIITY